MSASCTLRPNTTIAASWPSRKTCRSSASSAKLCVLMKWRAKQTKYVTGETKILSDHPHLLHQRLAAHRAHIHDHCGRRHPPLQTHPRLRGGDDHWHGRAWRQRGAHRQESRHTGIRIRCQNGRRVEVAVGRTWPHGG